MHGREVVEAGQLSESAAASLGFEERLLWYLNRLRCMTPAEVGHRVVRKLSMHAERDGLSASGRVPSPDLRSMPRPWIHADARVDAGIYLAAADRIADGRLDVFALKNADVGS